MLDATEFDRWRSAASEDRRAADVQPDARIHNWDCFLAEQSAVRSRGAAPRHRRRSAGQRPVLLGRNDAAALGEPLCDNDMLVVSDSFAGAPRARDEQLGRWPAGGVQPIAWTPEEWRAQIERGNPIAREAAELGVWLRGGVDDLTGPERGPVGSDRSTPAASSC